MAGRQLPKGKMAGYQSCSATSCPTPIICFATRFLAPQTGFFKTSGSRQLAYDFPMSQSHHAGAKPLGCWLFLLICLVPLVVITLPFLQLSAPYTDAMLVPARDMSGCQRLLWFTAISSLYSNTQKEYEDYIKVAFLSAREKAPSLIPVLLFSGQPNKLTKWFQARDGVVISHQLSFLHEFASLPEAHAAHREHIMRNEGYYLRLDIPIVMQALEAWGLVNMANVSATYALYTDADIMFVGGDISTCTIPLPDQLSLGPEHEKGQPKNSGVMLFNVPEMRKELPSFLSYGRENNFSSAVYDQGWLVQYRTDYNKSWPAVADEMNWKVYWGSNPNALILHWHGPKPRLGKCIECFLEQRQQMGWEKRCGGCHPAYIPLLQFAQAADGGKMCARMLAKFEEYAQRADKS